MVNLLHNITYCFGDKMKLFLKIISPLLVITILMSSCAFNNSEKSLEQIEDYLVNNEYNACYQLVKEMDIEDKQALNKEVCDTVINKFIELRNKTKINETNFYDLSLIDTYFAESCQKLWNIISEFTIDDNYELYYECINLRYYSEMIDYTRYCDIYTLLKMVNDSDYLNKLSTALYDYESKGTNSTLKLLFDEINSINLSSFDPQQYLVSDFRNAHNRIVSAINELDDGFSANDSTTVASAINTLHHALEDILYITDTVIVVNTMQKTIYNKLSSENLYAPFENEINITKREYTSGMQVSLEIIFGGKQELENNETVESTTTKKDDEISLEDAIDIATTAINNTKVYTDNLDVTLTQTRNIKLTAFETDSTIADAENMIRSELNNSISKSNGTGKKTTSFSNGVCGNTTLNNYIPPTNTHASINKDSVKNYTCTKGSGGYIIKFTLNPELIKSGKKSNGIGLIINTFEFDNSSAVKDFDTSYSETNITIIVNNSKKLIEMEYNLNGISNCVFDEKNTSFEYKAQFTFNNKYLYEFKYR